ncbi:ATP-binding cassette subfamily C protein CydC [Rhizobium sp. BK313]|uniref:amino acid ABC transporter ATP-binding/permease protein n=1 Tax=Rhizobium sp. BK313 TaxID=2587081 RepID=UPI00105D41D3|nr:amino acid ABC transporter ATP-binding/permease protein [Rhizobium sp. BK313]MBB3452023.1 ATP-binding cassette subfamily C protein CydC [Rhizobium sp. BK313]
MKRSLTTLLPVIRLFQAERGRGLCLGTALSALAVLAGAGLLGLSGWFITATALAGISATSAIVFDVFAPSAGIRLLAIGRTAARYGERLVTHDVTLRVLAALRERLFRGWAAPGNAAAMMRRPAKLLFRLTADIDALDSLYLRVLLPAGVALLSALAIGVALGLMQPLFGILVGLWLVATGLGIPLIAGRMAMKPGRRRAHAMEALRARVIDLVAGQTELAMTRQLRAQRIAIDDADRRLAEADHELNRIENAVSVGFSLVSTLLLTATLLTVATLTKQGIIGAPAAAFGLLVAFAATEPFAALRRGALELGRTLLAAKRIAPRLATEGVAPEIRQPPQGYAFQLKAVSASYENARHPAVESLSLSLAAGERLALVGVSGAGKSTILALLAGEIAPASGTIACLRATMLTQRTELFDDTIRGNLLLADPLASDEQLRHVLQAANLLADIQALPKGLSARLGEGGIGLSGGQSRRLALARLFLRDTPLWLLDEPTEGLDGETARAVLREIATKAAGRSLVIATHIRREAAIADRIAMLEHGRITATAQRGEQEFDAILDRLRPD